MKTLCRTAARNIVIHLPGNKNEVKSITSGLEACKLGFTKENLEAITNFTNNEIAIQKIKHNDHRSNDDEEDMSSSSVRPAFTRNTTVDELLALIGLLY